MKARVWFIVAVASSLWLGLAPRAQAQEADLVILANGGRVRGTVTDYVPGERVVVRLASGEVRMFVASEVTDVRFGDAPVAPPTPQIPLPTTAPPQEVSPLAAPLAPANPTLTWNEPRVFASPDSALAWDYDPELPITPRSWIRYGARLEGGVAMIWGLNNGSQPTVVAGGFVELVLTRALITSLRVELAVGFKPERGDRYTNGRGGEFTSSDGTGWLSIRALFGLHSHDEVFVIRFGGEVGPELVANYDGTPGVRAGYGGVLELATRWLDDRRLELFVSGFVGAVGRRNSSRDFLPDGSLLDASDEQRSEFASRFTAGASYAF